MTNKQFESKLKSLESSGWQFIEIYPTAKYAIYQKNGETIEIGKKPKQ